MKMRVCEYNENVVGLRIAHIDFYMDRDGYVACPFTKGEVAFSEQIASELQKLDGLRADYAALQTEYNSEVETATALGAYLDQAKAENDELKARLRWIPCAERMPQPGEVVLMWIQPHSYIPGNAKEGAYMPKINTITPWRSTWDMAVYSEEDITHWRPMPDRPEVQP